MHSILTTSNSKLRILYLNARSIRNKFADIEEAILSENYDIIGITETWLSIENRDFLAEYKIPGYIIFEKSRIDRNGGGVLIYIKEHLNPVELSKPQIVNINSLYLLLRDNFGKKIVIGLIYRPPSQPVHTDRQIYEQLCELSNIYDTVIMGDFNLPIPKWGEHINLHNGHDLYTNLLESSLCQLVHSQTRGNNILDLVLSTNDDMVDNLVVDNEYSYSDHRIITFDLKFNKKEPNFSNEKIPDFRKVNFQKIREKFLETDWNNCINSNDMNVKYRFFMNAYSKVSQDCIPFRKRRKSDKIKPNWWTDEIANCLREKTIARNRLKTFSNDEERAKYNDLRRKAKRLINQSKRLVEINIASQSKTNPKKFFSFIRQKRVITSTIGPLTDEAGDSINDEREMSNILNNFFASVFTTEDTSNIPVPPTIPIAGNNILREINVTEDDTLKLIDNLKVNKSPGPDGIYPRVLKEAKKELARPLTSIFNTSLQSSTNPDEWLLANVTPIFKKGSKSQPCNYRPISLTSIVCKMLETTIRDRIVKHLEDNKLIRGTQHGFRNKRSCLTNLLDFLYDVLNCYDESKAVDVIYLDFQKAFDKVPHKRLLAKLKAHGIDGSVLKWIENWLSNRKQRVVINGKESNWINVTSGVPQGSVLGPVLFLIYINDIDEGITCILSKFADDTKIASTVVSRDQVNEMQNNLNRLSDWAKTWQMKFNTDKCKVLHIGYRNEKATYIMDGNKLKNSNSEKDLGVTIASNLKPSQQCSEVVKKANKLVGFIGRSIEYKSKATIITLYNSLVRPIMEYCVQAWCPYYHKDIDKLERVQRRVTKLIPSLRNKSYEDRLKELDLFSLQHRRLRGDLIQVFKIIKGIDNMDYSKYFSIDRTGYTRGNGCKIIGKTFISNESKHFFFNRIVNLWNGLPRNVVECNTVDTFKLHLDKYLATNPRLVAFVSE